MSPISDPSIQVSCVEHHRCCRGSVSDFFTKYSSHFGSQIALGRYFFLARERILTMSGRVGRKLRSCREPTSFLQDLEPRNLHRNYEAQGGNQLPPAEAVKAGPAESSLCVFVWEDLIIGRIVLKIARGHLHQTRPKNRDPTFFSWIYGRPWDPLRSLVVH